MISRKEHLSLTITGHPLTGKTTLAGHLVYATRTPLTEEQKEITDGQYASLLEDRDIKEKVGVQVHYGLVEGEERAITFIDCPGLSVANFANGGFQGQVVLLVVPADDFETSVRSFAGGTIRDIFIHSQRNPQFVIAVNKMDKVGYSQGRFNYIKDYITYLFEWVKTFSFQPKLVDIIPISATVGDNVITLSSNTDWEGSGPKHSLLDTLRKVVELPPDVSDGIFAMPIFKIHPEALVGYVAEGSVKVGDNIRFLGKTERNGTVESIMHFQNTIETAKAGYLNVGIKLKESIPKTLKRGDVVVHANNPIPPGIYVVDFIAKVHIFHFPYYQNPESTISFKPNAVEDNDNIGIRKKIDVLEKHRNLLSIGSVPILYTNTLEFAAKVQDIKMDLKKVDEQPSPILDMVPSAHSNVKLGGAKQISPGMTATLLFTPCKKIFVDIGDMDRQMGTFSIFINSTLIGVGSVLDAKLSNNKHLYKIRAWERIKVLLLGMRDPNSALYFFPKDLMKIIISLMWRR